MNHRGDLQIPFAWLFAIIAGAVILFIAIFISTKIMNVGQYELDSKTAKDLGVLLNPLETSFETGKTTTLSTPSETRIYNKCERDIPFGRQVIQLSQKSFNKWPEPGGEVSFQNKYIFSDSYEEGKKFYIFSKPFNFPFKISDLVYLVSAQKKYCFINPPNEIKEEISEMNIENILVENCSNKKEYIRVCFSSSINCNIDVNYNQKFILKKGEKIYFEEDALMYAGIFSEKEIYECQVNRLMKRTNNLALLYKEKASLVSQTSGCSSNLNLGGLSTITSNVESSSKLSSIKIIAKDIEDKNELALCKIW